MCDPQDPELPDRSLRIYEINGYWRESGVLSPGDWNAYSLGYLEALQGLIKLVKERRFLFDTFGYPIFFLFHHYLEIRMKEIIINGRILIDESPDFPRTHNLNHLWIECKRILQEIEGWSEYSQLDDDLRQNFLTIDHFISEMAVDNSAQSFRYPEDINRNLLLNDPRIQRLNVHNIAIVANWMSFVFEGFSTEIDEEINAKRESMPRCREEFQ